MPLDLLAVAISSAAVLIFSCVSIDIFHDLRFGIGCASTITGIASVINGTMLGTTDTDDVTVGNAGVIDVCGFCCSCGVDGICVTGVGACVCSGVAGGS